MLMMDGGGAIAIIPRLHGTFGVAGVLSDETENNNAKWTLSAMEKYMRDQSESSVALGLVSQPPISTPNKRKPPAPQKYTHPADESAGEETSPSWASSSTGGNNTPSFDTSGAAFEFSNDTKPPVITTTSCTPHSTPKKGGSSGDLQEEQGLEQRLEQGLKLSLSKPGGRRSRKDSEGSVKGGKGTPTKAASKLSKLLRRTHSAGCSKDVPQQSQFIKDKTIVDYIREGPELGCPVPEVKPVPKRRTETSPKNPN